MFVSVKSAEDNLIAAQRQLDQHCGVLLQGAIGSGKTAVAYELAERNKCELHTVSVDDTMDSKDLIGKCMATDKPGEFAWVPGPLTVAVEQGHWLLLEDIDLASFDVFSAIAPLIERRTLFIPDQGKTLQAHPQCRIIATQQLLVTLDGQGVQHHSLRKGSTVPFAELWGSVFVNTMSEDEVLEVVEKVSGLPQQLARPVVEAVALDTTLSLRGVLRWAKRVVERFGTTWTNEFIPSTVRQGMLLEAIDIFCAWLPEVPARVAAVERMAVAVGVTPDLGKAMLCESKPRVQVSPTHAELGRVTLPRSAVVPQPRYASSRHTLALIERLAAAVQMNEPVLLTGETGIGKTFTVQLLAAALGHPLVVHNLNQQTEIADFMGGWKPDDVAPLVRSLYAAFCALFASTFDAEKNQNFLRQLAGAVEARQWNAVFRSVTTGTDNAKQVLTKRAARGVDTEAALSEWTTFELEAQTLSAKVRSAADSFMFKFEEGSLVTAWREGHWILLDEVNLASCEVLERIATFVGQDNALSLPESGSNATIPRHPNFRVFANMNPPTDVGKKNLPPSLRSKFTEVYVDERLCTEDLVTVVDNFVSDLMPQPPTRGIVAFFEECINSARTLLHRSESETPPPHFSLRTLTRALSYTRKATSTYGFRTALFDGLMMTFATPLGRQHHGIVVDFMMKHIFRSRDGLAASAPAMPLDGRQYVAYEHLWLRRGECEILPCDNFIRTPSAVEHLKNLARAVASDCPVLLEGPTSSGKSSMVQYLAEQTGHEFVRINNHDSTEVQEYLGQYVSDESGKLSFVDGVLVAAVRRGAWVVLDELNLAPTEVLEALNRLLDDNCELFIPDTQEVVKPHPSFRIFATQNPAGLYGGRKVLSRAFRNRFLEVTVDDLPPEEIVEILVQRFKMAPSFAKKMVGVMTKLQERRQSSHLFAGRHGFITPRDLFRWAERCPDDYQQLAEHGFLLIADRCRKPDERIIIRDVVETEMKVTLDEAAIYEPDHWPMLRESFEAAKQRDDGVVWTDSMRRLFTVTGLCLHHREPVLLVGETGCSKTTVCHIWACLRDAQMNVVNCHQHTEAADFLGALRPALPSELQQGQSKVLFVWRDGPLVRMMREGGVFLLDEISLAQDSVLERLNSVLEPSRTLTLAEKSNGEFLVAHDTFRFMATMNPGGDFGKRELSPALRNRFTEVYLPPITDRAEVATIATQRLLPSLQPCADMMADIMHFVAERGSTGRTLHISLRDVIGWVTFLNGTEGRCDPKVALIHGLDAVMLDGCHVGLGLSDAAAGIFREGCFAELRRRVDERAEEIIGTAFWELCHGMPQPDPSKTSYCFDAPTTRSNLSKILRATILRRAILLEGAPGVGKTTVVEALGAALSRTVVRINLSEHTDMMDLLGAFLPAGSEESGNGPAFRWSDGVLLRALKEGHWVILDELNLANQTVLEGLNALLDHREAVFLPEICQEVRASEGFRIFACQNPVTSGGGRKGLPKSFLNRFTRVMVQTLTRADLDFIVERTCAHVPSETRTAMIDFVTELDRSAATREIGVRGGPWEINLRDTLRWGSFVRHFQRPPADFVEPLFAQRFRSRADREAVLALFRDVTHMAPPSRANVSFGWSSAAEPTLLADGHPVCTSALRNLEEPLVCLPDQTSAVEVMLRCATTNQFGCLVGPTASGKTAVLKTAATFAGVELHVVPITAGCDTIDLLGGFEQVSGKAGEFEWRDSVLVRAMEQGHWVVLENANFCPPSVLDRLNPLVEPNGYISMNEQGLVNGEIRDVRPHAGFRLFATIDPKYGEISRAMRNRAVEVYCHALHPSSLDARVLLAAQGQRNAVSPEAADLVRLVHTVLLRDVFHVTPGDSDRLVDALGGGAPSMRTALRCLEMITEEGGVRDAVHHAFFRNAQWSSPALGESAALLLPLLPASKDVPLGAVAALAAAANVDGGSPVDAIPAAVLVNAFTLAPTEGSALPAALAALRARQNGLVLAFSEDGQGPARAQNYLLETALSPAGYVEQKVVVAQQHGIDHSDLCAATVGAADAAHHHVTIAQTVSQELLAVPTNAAFSKSPLLNRLASAVSAAALQLAVDPSIPPTKRVAVSALLRPFVAACVAGAVDADGGLARVVTAFALVQRTFAAVPEALVEFQKELSRVARLPVDVGCEVPPLLAAPWRPAPSPRGALLVKALAAEAPTTGSKWIEQLRLHDAALTGLVALRGGAEHSTFVDAAAFFSELGPNVAGAIGGGSWAPWAAAALSEGRRAILGSTGKSVANELLTWCRALRIGDPCGDLDAFVDRVVVAVTAVEQDLGATLREKLTNAAHAGTRLLLLGLWLAEQAKLRSPVDPMLRALLENQVLDEAAKKWLLAAMVSRRADSVRSTSALESFASADASSRGAELAAVAAEAAVGVVARPDSTGQRYLELYRRQTDAVAGLLAVDKVASLCRSAEKERALRGPKLEQSESEAENVALTTWAGLARDASDVQLRFEGYDDVTVPFATALLAASSGALSAAAWRATNDMAQPGSVLRPADALLLTQFPAPELRLVPAHPSMPQDRSGPYVAYLDACVRHVAQYTRSLEAGDVHPLFETFRRVLAEVEARDERIAEAERDRVLYKEKATIIEGDDERLARRVKEMFPSFLAAFEDTEGSDDDDADAANTGAYAQVLLRERQGERIRRAVRAHHRFFTGALYQRITRVDPSLDGALHSARFDALLVVLRSEQPPMPGLAAETEARVLHGFELAANALTVQQRHGVAAVAADENAPVTGDPYNDAFESEVAAALPTLRKAAARARELLEEYNEVPSLLRIADIWARLERLPVQSTPLMKVLTGVELLLAQLFEWQRVASTATSITEHISAVCGVVIRWRRLELRAWPLLFDSKVKAAEARTAHHWAGFFDLARSVRLGTADVAALAQHATEFMWAAHAGEFKPRLQLLEAFGAQLLVDSDGDEAAIRAGHVLVSLAKYFGQFEPTVAEAIENALVPLREEMREFTKIMRWEDATFYAIRASTQKSHTAVARVLARLEEALMLQAKQIIKTKEEKDTQPPAEDENQPENSAAAGKKKAEPKPKKKSKKGKKAEEVEEVVEDPARPYAVTGAGTVWLRQLTADVSEQVATLQADKKTPLGRKQRALKTFFETLSDSGVGHTHEHATPEWTLFFAADATAVVSSAAPLRVATATPSGLLADDGQSKAKVAEPALVWPGVDTNFYRAVRAVQLVRQAAQNPHSDLSGGQATRAVGTIETLFRAAADARARLSSWDAAAALVSEARRIAAAAGKDGPLHEATAFASGAIRVATEVVRLCGQADSVPKAGDAAALEPLRVLADRIVHDADELRRTSAKVCAPQEVAALRAALAELEEKCTAVATSSTRRTVASAAAEITPRIMAARTMAVPHSAVGEKSTKKRQREAWAMQVAAELSQLQQALHAAGGEPSLAPEEHVHDDDDAAAAADTDAQRPRRFANAEAEAVAVGAAVSAVKLEALLQVGQHRTGCDDEHVADIVRQATATTAALQASGAALLAHADALQHAVVVFGRVFRALLEQGFCRSEEEEEDNGEQGEGGMQDGTGMDDGQGAKDVTDELENEDQLMNMKDKEEPQEDADGEDDGKAAEVETDFQAKKEKAEDDDDGDDDEEDEENKEMGDVDPEDADQDRKRQRQKERDDAREDEGGDAEEVPEDDLGSEGDDGEKGEKDSNADDEETGGFGGKEEELKEGDERNEDEKKDDFLDQLPDVNSEDGSEDGAASEASGDTRSVGTDDDAEAGEDDPQGSDEDDQLPPEGDDGSAPHDIDPDMNPDGAEADKADGEAGTEDDNASDGTEAPEDEDDEAKPLPDENDHAGGEQDDRDGEEATENRQDQQAPPEDAAGTEEQQTGEQQQLTDTGRSWKRKQNTQQKSRADAQQSSRKTQQDTKQSALKESEKARPLDMNKATEADADDKDGGSDGAMSSDDDFEFAEDGKDAGLAPVDQPADDAEANLPSDKEGSGSDEDDAAEDAEEKQHKERRRKGQEDADNGEEGSGEDEESKAKSKKQKAAAKKAKLVKDDDDEDDVPAEELAVDEDPDMAAARMLWAEHEAAMLPLAQQLCEQLRLILEPTVADKLEGDFKSGKRLNMKRIIPFIASQYRKDKIWLRRTRPNKRSYQLVVAVDDSHSMAHNGANTASCQAVALICKALQQLEVGEFSVAKFGKEPEVLHPLGGNFGADTGPTVFSKFTFSQASTNMRCFLSNMLDYMDTERLRATAQVRSTTHRLLQVLFVISDGHLTEDRMELRKLVARAEAAGQVVVLIILDVKAATDAEAPTAAEEVPAPANTVAPRTTAAALRARRAEREARAKQVQKQSVLDMQTVQFVGNKVVKKSYFDEFPFPFYIVVRELRTLPEVLADAMKQWFEVLSQSFD